MKNLIYILLFLTSVNYAQTYAPTINLDDVETETYTTPTNIPEYLVPFTNEYGFTVTRVSDADEFGINDLRLGHNYSKDQPWNSDGSLIKLAGYPAAILDGESYEFLFWANIPSYGRWANTEPSYMYGTPSNRFVKFNVYTNSSVTLRAFSEFSSIDFGYGEGNQDDNDRFVGLIGINGSSRTFIVYDILNDTYTTRPVPSVDLDWFSVSSLGTYAVANIRGVGIVRYNIDLTNEVLLSNISQHGDLGLDENGAEVYVQMGYQSQWDDDYYLMKINLATGENTNLFYWNSSHGNSGGIWGAHLSMRTNRQGVVYISENCCPTHSTLPNSLFALHIDGSNDVEILGHHNTDKQGVNADSHSARIVPNRDGTKIMFVSNWYLPQWKANNSGYAFILEVPQETLSVPTFDANSIPLETHYYNLLGQYLGTEKPKAQGIYIQKSVFQNRVLSKLIPVQ